MLPIITNLVSALLLSAATLTNPTTPKALSFDASAFVTVNNQIRLSVVKNSTVPVVVLLRDRYKEVIYRQTLSTKEDKQAILFKLDDLSDGQYELEIKSCEGSIRKQLKLSSAPAQQQTRVIALAQ
ncbi:hypothetical protein ACFSUS_26735 [Spirosoma soli]|uniref:DUF3244 domain-containing protein n=1 Tax=Spirosoma soli TaxID=1770529 RepID=A0ABW5MB86_9BACT